MTATSGLDSLRANAIVGATVGQAGFPTFTNTSGGYLKFIASGANENTNGTEIATGGGYSAGGFNFPSSSVWGTPAYSAGVSSVTNSGASGAMSVTNMPAVTVTQAEVWDSAGTKLRWWWGQLTTSVTTNSGDTLTFATSSISMQFAI